MNKRIRAEYVFFFFVILFLPKIGLFDTKIFALLVLLVVSVSKSKRLMIYNKFIIPVTCIILLIILFFIHSLQNETDLQILLRYIRCIISTICIMSYINVRRPDEKTIIESLSVVLSLHALTILLSIVLPTIRPYIYVISGYSKKYLPLRSTGLLSGYDFAGYYLNAGILLRVIYNSKYNNKIFDFTIVLYIVAALFTSRINTIILIIEIAGIIIYMIGTKRISSFVSLFVIIVPIILAGSIFSILTIETFSPLKTQLIQRYRWVSVLNQTINLTYANSTLDDALKRHYDIEENVDLLFGNGITPQRDPGMIKSVYEGGFYALFLKIIFYLYICIYAFRRRNNGVIPLFIFMYVILTTIFELKLAFYFSTGSYELLITMFSISLAQNDRLLQTQKMYKVGNIRKMELHVR